MAFLGIPNKLTQHKNYIIIEKCKGDLFDEYYL